MIGIPKSPKNNNCHSKTALNINPPKIELTASELLTPNVTEKFRNTFIETASDPRKELFST